MSSFSNVFQALADKGRQFMREERTRMRAAYMQAKQNAKDTTWHDTDDAAFDAMDAMIATIANNSGFVTLPSMPKAPPPQPPAATQELPEKNASDAGSPFRPKGFA